MQGLLMRQLACVRGDATRSPQGLIFEEEPRLLRELRQCEVQLDRLHMNAALTAQRAGQWRSAVQLMKEMRQAASLAHCFSLFLEFPLMFLIFFSNFLYVCWRMSLSRM